MATQTHRQFHFLREIATGGFGNVYLAKVMHPDGFSRVVAVKLLKTQWTDSEEVAKRTRDEARLLGLLRHKNIVDVLDLTSIDGRAAVIMEYIEAVDLGFLVEQYVGSDQRIPPRISVTICAIVAQALDAAYNKPPMPGEKPLRVIHRDIKPSNIMVDAEGLVKILDFGVARSEIDNRESNTQELQFGSIDYMAPERLFFEPEAPASDVYSLAATLFELVALERLGKAKGRPERHAAFLWERTAFLREAGKTFPGLGDLEALLREALDYDHERRPTAAQFSNRAKAIARTLGEDDLESWAEIALPPLIKVSQDAARAPESLTNSVLTEDSIVFRRSDPVASFPDAVDGEDEQTDLSDAPEAMALEKSREDEVPLPAPPTGGTRTGTLPDVSDLGFESETMVHHNNDPFQGMPDRTDTLLTHDLQPQEKTHELPTPVIGSSIPVPVVEEPEPDPPTSSGSRLGWVIMALVAVLVMGVMLGTFGLVYMLDVGGLKTRLGSATAAVIEQPAAIGEPSGPEAPSVPNLGQPTPEPAPPAVPEDAIVFVSLMEGTHKINARCTEGSGSGSTQAVVEVAEAATCTVTAILKDRNRVSTVLNGVTKGEYQCFAEGEASCTR